jgi:hypothetical protein
LHHRNKIIACLLPLVVMAVTFATGGCVMPPFQSKPVVPAAIKVNVTDQAITSLRASLSVFRSPPTSGCLEMSLPVTDPQVLTTEHASGKLTTSEDINFVGVPLPRRIELQDGKATANVDLLKF